MVVRSTTIGVVYNIEYKLPGHGTKKPIMRNECIVVTFNALCILMEVNFLIVLSNCSFRNHDVFLCYSLCDK